MKRTLLLMISFLVGLASSQGPEEPASGVGIWIEHFDKQSGKPFFYNSVSRETAWEPPPGVKVQYMSEGERSGSGSTGNTKSTGSSWAVFAALILPIVLPMVGLLVCYHMASKEGLADVLKSLKAKRDRSNKRRSTKAGGGFRHRQKLSQDGKGGRSANS